MLAPHINPETNWARPWWGTIDCPHCDARGITKVAKNQVTCGKSACRQKQCVLAARIARNKKARKRKVAQGFPEINPGSGQYRKKAAAGAKSVKLRVVQNLDNLR